MILPSRAFEGIDARPLVTDDEVAVNEVIVLVVIAVGFRLEGLWVDPPAEDAARLDENSVELWVKLELELFAQTGAMTH